MKGFPNSIDADVAGLDVSDAAGDEEAGGAESPKKQPTLPSSVPTVSEATIQRFISLYSRVRAIGMTSK